MRTWFWIGLILTAASASAQKWEVGGLAAIGGYGEGAPGNYGNSYGVFGGDVCVACNRRIALYGQYAHFAATSSFTRSSSVDLGTVGARFQGRVSRRVRPFFDAGLSFERQHSSTIFIPPASDQNLIGVGFGGGVTIHIGSRYYVRPTFQLHIVTPGSSPNAAALAGVSVGLRF